MARTAAELKDRLEFWAIEYQKASTAKRGAYCKSLCHYFRGELELQRKLEANQQKGAN